jgi:hypothetical protein
MDHQSTIRSLSSQPIPHQLLMTLLKDYDRPNDKIHSLLTEGTLQSIRKGLYIAGPAINEGKKPEPFLVANHILGPSYVSLETALSYHGLIPERVYEIASMTTKSARKFSTPLGSFTYTKLALPYYAYGIDSVKLANDQYALIASPEKALFDKIVTTSGVLFRSRKSVLEYLVENLRVDEDTLRKLDTKTMETWLANSFKKESLLMVVETLKGI